MKFFILTLCFFSLFFFSLDRYFFKENHSFCISHILPNWSHCPQYATRLDSATATILDQPFTYLTKGKQSFVFLSSDEKWVLKIPRLPREIRKFGRKSKNVTKFLTYYHNIYLAYDELPFQTRVIYAHLSPTQTNHRLHLIDRFHMHYHLSMDILPFFLQKKGEDFFSYFDKQVDPRPLITKTFALFSTLYEKGWIDKDPIWENNFGVIKNEPVLFDFGQLQPITEPISKEQYLQEMTHSLKVKLLKERTDLLPYYEKHL